MVFLREFALDSKEVVAFTLLNTYVSIHPLIRIIKSRKLYIREGGIFTFNFLRNEKSNFFLLLLFYRATMKVLSEISLVFDTTRNFSSFQSSFRSEFPPLLFPTIETSENLEAKIGNIRLKVIT